jgi:hypothetical protein
MKTNLPLFFLLLERVPEGGERCVEGFRGIRPAANKADFLRVYPDFYCLEAV